MHVLHDYDLSGKFLALTRWNVRSSGLIELHGCDDSQDAWIFEAPLPKMSNAHKIFIGVVRCDNCIAYTAAQAGLEVINPSLSIQSCHLHTSSIFTNGHDDITAGNVMAVTRKTLKTDICIPLEKTVKKYPHMILIQQKNADACPVAQACALSQLYDTERFDIIDIMKAELIIAYACVNELEIETTEYKYAPKHCLLWSGLKSLATGNYDTAYEQLQKAIEQGLNHWRIHWYKLLAKQRIPLPAKI